MSTEIHIPTDSEIRAAAIRKGFADASVVRHIERRPYYLSGEIELTEQTWYVLSVKRTAGAEFEVIGRRKTTGELMTLIGSR